MIRSITTRAWLADPGSEVERARERARAGDCDWARWVSEFERGDALLIDMRVTLSVELDDGATHEVTAENHQVWILRTPHPPLLAATIAEMSSKDYDLFVRRLKELGVALEPRELDGMYVDVELDDRLLCALHPSSAPDRLPLQEAARAGTETRTIER